MNIRIALATVVLLAAAAPGPATALTCYLVLDRSDNVVYRDTYPPVDMSDQGAAERERLRRRGEHLVAMESDRCPALEFFTGTAGSTAVNVDQMVGGVPVRRDAAAESSDAPPPAARPTARGKGTRAPAARPAG